MKKIVALFMSILICSGCGSTAPSFEEKPNIELVANEGSVEAITFDETIEKIDNDDTFIVLLSSTYCNACLDFHMQSDAYTKEVGLTYYAIVLDDEPTSEQENLDKANELFGHFSATPSLYLIQDGEVRDRLTSDTEETSLTNFQTFLRDNEIID